VRQFGAKANSQAYYPSEGALRFSHQDSLSADVWERHCCSSGPCASEVLSAACREPAPRARARSRWRLAEALTSDAHRALQLGVDSWW